MNSSRSKPIKLNPVTRAIPKSTFQPLPLSQQLEVWGWLALNSFGGPAAQIANMHRMVVVERRWVSEERFLHALSYCMLLPGPEATQLACYLGWLVGGPRGALLAGWFFVLPNLLFMLILSFLYLQIGQTPALEGVFLGLKAAVLALVLEALIRLWGRALKTRRGQWTAFFAFVGLFFLGLPFPLIIVLAGSYGFFTRKNIPLEQLEPAKLLPETPLSIPEELLYFEIPSSARAFKTLLLGLLIWWLPVGIFALLGFHALRDIGIFFAQTAVITFGGAYSILAYIAQQAVEVYGWLKPLEMLDGLGLAETTPGPLIGVVQFVGYLGAFRLEVGLSPHWAGFWGAVLTCWVTFVPCFLWIFLGAPYVERLRQNTALTHALASISAAVVGVIAQLSLWFALHTFFFSVKSAHWGPIRWLEVSQIRLGAVAIALFACVVLLRFKWKIVPLLLVCMGLGVLARA